MAPLAFALLDRLLGGPEGGRILDLSTSAEASIGLWRLLPAGGPQGCPLVVVAVEEILRWAHATFHNDDVLVAQLLLPIS